MTVAFKYALFAILAMAVNIGSQYISFNIYDGPSGIYVAMFWGTLTGLIVKYVLDKRYIFRFHSTGLKEDTVKFFLYSLMGLFTTMIFWGFELFFYVVFPYESSKYVGAIIGLIIGYNVKYHLDKRFVFA